MIIVTVRVEQTKYGRIKAKVLNEDIFIPEQIVDSMKEVEERISNWYWYLQKIPAEELKFDYDV